MTAGLGGDGPVGVALGRVDRREVAGDRQFIAACRRPGERRGRAELGDVVDGPANDRQVGLERRAGCRPDPFDLTEKRDQVVGGDAGGGVVLDAVVVGDDEGTPAERFDDFVRDPITGRGEPGVVAKSLGAGRGVRQRHERMHRGPPLVGREDVEPERPGTVGHNTRRLGFDRGGHVGHRAIPDADQNEINVTRRDRDRCGVPADRAVDLPANRGQGRGE